MNDSLVLYQPLNYSVQLPNTTNIVELLKYNHCLPENDAKKVVVAYDNGLYDMAAEYIWSRTINTLKRDILKFGEDFVEEMIDRPSIDSVDDISEYEIISLAADLGFIDKTAKIEFVQYSEIIHHYMSKDDEEEFPVTKLLDIVRSCVKNVLGVEQSEYELPFSSFRKGLKEKYVSEGDDLYEKIITAPYFYKRTTFKTMMSLAKNTPDSAEREIVLNNLRVILIAIWANLTSEDRWVIGMNYAQSLSEGDRNMVIALKAILLSVKGFDYVPENLRSTSYISAAKDLIVAHQGANNFYNEPSKAKYLSNMGNSIPAPAFGICMTAVLACKLGNAYGISWDAQPSIDLILDSVSEERWKYYFSNVLLHDEIIISKLLHERCIDRWRELIQKYKLDELELDAQKEIKELLNANEISTSRIIMNARKILEKM